MTLPEEGSLLRIFIDEQARYQGKILYEWLVLQAQQHGLAGATVFRGIMGFGPDSRIQTARIMRLSEDLPVVIEIIDTAEKLENFLTLVSPAIHAGLVTLEKAHVRIYRGGSGKK